MDIKLKSKIKYLLFILLMFLSINTSYAKEVPDHDSNYYIDELVVLSETSKKAINGQQLPDGAQIFVLTVDKMDEDPFDYGMKAFKKYQLGDKDKDNGLLIFLARTSEGKHHIKVITGYGLEGILPDGKVGRIIDNYMMDDFSKGNLDNGIIKGFAVFASTITKAYEKERQPASFVENKEVIQESEGTAFPINLKAFGAVMGMFFVVPLLLNGMYLLFKKIEEKSLIRKINNMTYEDFISYNKINSDNYKLLSRRFDEISSNKNIQTLKQDMLKAHTLKSLFENKYTNKKELEIRNKNIEELINESKGTDNIDYYIYKNLIEEKIRNISSKELSNLMFISISLEIYNTIKEEYIIRKKKDLLKLSLNDLATHSYKDDYLNDKEMKNMIDNLIIRKTTDMEDEELEKALNDANTDKLRHLIFDEQNKRNRERERRKKEAEERKRREKEEERRRRSYYDDDDDDDWYFNSSSWSSFGGSSFGGGFSGGGGSSGGGGAGRSF